MPCALLSESTRFGLLHRGDQRGQHRVAGGGGGDGHLGHGREAAGVRTRRSARPRSRRRSSHRRRRGDRRHRGRRRRRCRGARSGSGRWPRWRRRHRDSGQAESAAHDATASDDGGVEPGTSGCDRKLPFQRTGHRTHGDVRRVKPAARVRSTDSAVARLRDPGHRFPRCRELFGTWRDGRMGQTRGIPTSGVVDGCGDPPAGSRETANASRPRTPSISSVDRDCPGARSRPTGDAV